MLRFGPVVMSPGGEANWKCCTSPNTEWRSFGSSLSIKTRTRPSEFPRGFSQSWIHEGSAIWRKLTGQITKGAAQRLTGERMTMRSPAKTGGRTKKERCMNRSYTTNFKATALAAETLRTRAPSIFAVSPMQGVSSRYTFVPTSRIVDGLRAMDWLPVDVEEQRIRKEAKRGFQKHLIRFRRAEQMETLDEWNVELVLLNSHDAGSAYELHAGIFRRICCNGLVVASDSFETIRFRHAGLNPEEVVQASMRVVEYMPAFGRTISGMQERKLDGRESMALAANALRLRYTSAEEAPVGPNALLRAQRPEDEGEELWRTMNRVAENLIRGGLADGRLNRSGRLRSLRALRGIDSKVTVNKGVWRLAERLLKGEELPEVTALPA